MRRPSPEAQDEVQRVSLFQLKIAELLIRAAELLSAEDYALLFRGDSLCYRWCLWRSRRGAGFSRDIGQGTPHHDPPVGLLCGLSC